MNRRTRTLVVVGVAVLLAAVASFGVYTAVQRIPVVEVPIAERQQVIAVEAIPVGVLIAKEQVKLAPWPADSPLEGGFTTLEEVIGRGVTGGFVANEPIIETKLATREAGGGMPPMIPQGMRAMSIRVNDIIGVAGYTTPGTRVDVVVTSRTGGEDSMSRTVLSNVQVLAAGTRYEEDRARKEPIPTAVVTLLVTPPDGEKLTLAQSQGQLTLALRNPLDIEPTKTAGVRMRELMTAPGAEPIRTTVAGRPRVITPPPPPPPPPPPSIEMINGTQRKQEILKGQGGSGGAGSF